MSEKTHLDAVMALLTAANAQPRTLQQLRDAAALPSSYNEVTVSQKFGSGPRRSGAAAETTQWRIFVRSVAQEYANAQEMRRRAALALHEAALSVDGESFFIERAVSDDPIAEDSSWWSGTSEFGY